MKKLTALLLALAMSLAFVACGNEAAPEEVAPVAPVSPANPSTGARI